MVSTVAERERSLLLNLWWSSIPLTDWGKVFQAIADLCLKDSLPVLVFGLSSISFKLSLIFLKIETAVMRKK